MNVGQIRHADEYIFIQPVNEKPVNEDDFIEIEELVEPLESSVQNNAPSMISQMEKRLSELIRENDDLRNQLLVSAGRYSTLELSHRIDIEALQGEVNSLNTLRKEMMQERNDMMQEAAKLNQDIVAAYTAQRVALQSMNAAREETASVRINEEKLQVELLVQQTIAKNYESEIETLKCQLASAQKVINAMNMS